MKTNIKNSDFMKIGQKTGLSSHKTEKVFKELRKDSNYPKYGIKSEKKAKEMIGKFIDKAREMGYDKNIKRGGKDEYGFRKNLSNNLLKNQTNTKKEPAKKRIRTRDKVLKPQDNNPNQSKNEKSSKPALSNNKHVPGQETKSNIYKNNIENEQTTPNLKPANTVSLYTKGEREKRSRNLEINEGANKNKNYQETGGDEVTDLPLAS